MIVVVPTVRSIKLEYFGPLIDAGARFIIVDDSEGSLQLTHPQFTVYNWGDQHRLLGNLEIAIPRRNGACRDFGYYLAWREADPNEVIIAVDDDCIVNPHFVTQVHRALSHEPRPEPFGSDVHWNMLDAYRNPTPNLFPRGFPYTARLGYMPWRFDHTAQGEVKFNVGLWQNIFDVNAVDKLHGPPYIHPEATLLHESVLVPQGVLISVCAGNTHFRKELIPAAYNLVMHCPVLPGWVIDRYGDIWSGFILKRLMDLRGDRMTVGAPMIYHLKEGHFQKNIWQEHLGHLVNEEFIAFLDEAVSAVQPARYLDMMEHLNEEFCRRRQHCSPLLGAYVKELTVTLGAWLQALRKCDTFPIMERQ